MHMLAYNTRFLILPWVQVEHLASAHSGPHGQACSARLAADLRASYLLVGDIRRYLALSWDMFIRAANWRVVGTTVGRGHRAAYLRADDGQ